ncbi:uncharacterized protein METZ01_LOCUS184150, partial [marine metagenome]
MTGLSSEQVTRFREDGYLLLEDAFDADVLDGLQTELTERIDRWCEQALGEGLLSDLLPDAPFDKRLALLSEQLENPGPLLAVVGGKLRTVGMFQILTHPDLLDIVQSVIGPEILAHPQFNSRA